MSTLVKLEVADTHPVRGDASGQAYIPVRDQSQSSLPDLLVPIPSSLSAATEKGFWVSVIYHVNNATPNWANYAYTLGNQAPTYVFTQANAGNSTYEHCVLSYWSNAAINAAEVEEPGAIKLRETATGNIVRSITFGYVDGMDQTKNPTVRFESNNDTNYPRDFPKDAGQNMPGIAGDAQVAHWVFVGTNNREFVTDTDWTEAANGDWTGAVCEHGVSYGGGEQKFSLESVEVAQTNWSHAMLIEFPTDQGGGTVVSGINNGQPIKVGNESDQGTQNYGTGSGILTATGFTLGGLAQANFTVVDDNRFEFDTFVEGSPGLAFGTQNGVLLHPGGNVAVNGLTLAPQDGYTYGAMTGVTAPADDRSIVNLFTDAEVMAAVGGNVAALSIGDQIWYETLDGALSIDLSDGTWTWSPDPATGLDPLTDGYGFVIRARRANDADAWSPWIPVIVNGKSLIENIDGVSSGNGILDFTSVNSVISGKNFTDVAGKVYIQVAFGDKRDDDLNLGLAVEQPGGYTTWTDTQIIQPSWTRGALPAGVKYAFFAVPGGAIT